MFSFLSFEPPPSLPTCLDIFVVAAVVVFWCFLGRYGQPQDQALRTLRAVLPPNAVLVGMNIRKDIEWLGLVEGRDYEACIDLAALFRVWNDEKRCVTTCDLCES